MVVYRALVVQVCGSLGVAECLALEAFFIIVGAAPSHELAVVKTWLSGGLKTNS